MKNILVFSAVSILLAVAGNASAQTTFRCKTPSGGTVFSDAPCSGGARQEGVIAGGSAEHANRPADATGSARNGNSGLLDAKVAEAIGSGDITRAKSLALTPLHWQMIADAEQRGRTTVTGRTSADLRAEARTSSECKDAERSYDVEASSIRHDGAQVGAAKRRMYSACGMDEPTNINVDNRTTIRSATVPPRH